MNRILAGPIAGAVAVAGVIEVQQLQLRLLIIVVGVLTGLVAGLVAGLREPHPRTAMTAGLFAGMVAGALLAGTALYQASIVTPVTPIASLAIALAGASLVVCMGVSVPMAGIVSAWSGFPYHRLKHGASLRYTTAPREPRLRLAQLPEPRQPQPMRRISRRPATTWPPVFSPPVAPEQPQRAGSSGPLGPLPNLV